MRSRPEPRSRLASVSFAFVAALALAWAAPAAAHHGWSGYREEPRKLTGVVKAVDYSNPHATVKLEASDRLLLVVLAPPSRMEARGLPREGLVVGETVTVEAYPHESHADELRAEWIEARGKRTQLR
jgi:hypothetical protein